MGQWYWISQYAGVMLAYGFVLYLWPMVVFEKHLAGKSLTYRFGFCVTVPPLLINAGVLFLGLLHVLRPWVTSILFFGVFLWRLFANHPPFRRLAADVQALSHGSMTARRLLLRSGERLRSGLKNWFSPFWTRTAGKRAELALLLVLVLFGTIYFSYGAFDEHSYGCGDMYVHHQWIHGLVEGKAFYNGIYPEGMHCVVYLTSTLFGIPLFSGMQFLAGVHIHVLLIGIYLFMREVFRSRVAPLAALALFLMLNQTSFVEVVSMSRLYWTLPMEYALHTAFLSAAFLMRFLRAVARGRRVTLHPFKPKQWGILHDPDLFLFAACVALSLAVHFFCTIIAAFFCIIVALVYLRQILRKGSFVPLAAAVLIAFGAAVAPMGAAYAAGYPLQGSLYWAMGVIDKSRQQTQTAEDADAVQQTPDPDDTSAQTQGAPAVSDPAAAQNNGGAAVVAQTSSAPETHESAPFWRRAARAIGERLMIVWEHGLHSLYPGGRGYAILAAGAFALVTALPAHFLLPLAARIRRKRAQKRDAENADKPDEEPDVQAEQPQTDALDGVLVLVLLAGFLMMMYVAGRLGIPQLLEGVRLCSSEQALLAALYCVPLDYLAVLLARRAGRKTMAALAWVIVLGIYALTMSTGLYHSYLHNILTRYEAAVELTNRFIDTLPKFSYTIVSTTEELYQVIETGYHEELLTFLQREKDPTYTIPTPYLLLYIEKRPLYYAQYHYPQGPRWLAREEYVAISPIQSTQCPKILSGEISEEAAKETILYGSKLSDSATELKGRIILESKAYAWYQAFSAMHPRACSVVYEDENFLCCCITQNPYCLYTLGIMEETEAEAAP